MIFDEILISFILDSQNRIVIKKKSLPSEMFGTFWIRKQEMDT